MDIDKLIAGMQDCKGTWLSEIIHLQSQLAAAQAERDDYRGKHLGMAMRFKGLEADMRGMESMLAQEREKNERLSRKPVLTAAEQVEHHRANGNIEIKYIPCEPDWQFTMPKLNTEGDLFQEMDSMTFSANELGYRGTDAIQALSALIDWFKGNKK